MLALAQAVVYNPQLLDSVLKRLHKLRDTVSWGPIVTAQQFETIAPELRPLLLRPWPSEFDQSTSLWTATVTSRERMLYLGQYELPRFFSWVYPARLAGMSTPRTEADINTLRDMGFTHILSLAKESPLSEDWFAFKLVHISIPIRNFRAPTVAEMDIIYDKFQSGGTWLIHCGGGVGRAGTVLACLIAMLGRDDHDHMEIRPRLDANTAVSILRHARPRSLESDIQEKFVTLWISHRWKLSHAPTIIQEPYTKFEHNAQSFLNEDVTYFLIGLPGSGKSWFANAISKRRPKGKTVIIAGQDENGSRAACESQLGRRPLSDTMIILDRCNPSISERMEWLKIAGRICVAVQFNYLLELCRQRIDARLNHQSLRPGRGDTALAQFEKQMQVPSTKEGFAAVLTITSFSAARDAVYRMTGDPPLLKFPRTPHLLDLGASTSDDVVLDSFSSLTGNLTIEEKLDGANLGISLDWNGVIRVQNRSHWISSAEHHQFRQLDNWIEEHLIPIYRLLNRDAHFPERFILYGEWVFAKHSIHYTSLPAPFFAFDLYDRLNDTFLSHNMLSEALRGTGIHQVPLIMETCLITRTDILQLMQRSSMFTSDRIEGVVIRTEDVKRKLTIERAKVVRGDFNAGTGHWAKAPLVLNGIARGFSGEASVPCRVIARRPLSPAQLSAGS